MKSNNSAQRALPLMGSVRLPPPVLRTRSSSGMPWDSATVAQLLAGARTSRLLRKSRLVPVTASATVKPRPQLSSAASEDFIITAAAQLALSASDTVRSGNLSGTLSTGMSLQVAKQAEAADLLASEAEAAKTQANAQKQAQINALTAAILSLTALLKHELMVLDFAGAIVIGLILIDLSNQLAQLL